MESSSSSNRTESAAEFVATVRKDHDVMMEWYNNNNTSHELQPLREKYGPKYPESWKHVLNWNGWKETRKAYVQYLQQRESSTTTVSSSSNDRAPEHTNETSSAVANPTTDNNTITPTNATVTATNEELKNDTAAKPKRKSRWGSVSTTTTTETTTATTSSGTNGSTTTNGTLTNTNDGNTIVDTSNGSKRGRWGTTTLPATETTTSSELEQLRSQLRSLNYKIDHVVEEANRIDALPHNHRERSVSPPPSYVYIDSFFMIAEWMNFLDSFFSFIVFTTPCAHRFFFSLSNFIICSLWTGWETPKYSCGTIQRKIYDGTSRFVRKDFGIDESTTTSCWG
jgi:hypothetical protein